MQTNKIVVAYSGGLDTSVMVKWLSKKYNAEIITVTGNLGQKSELINLEEKALSTGASKAYIVNLQKDESTIEVKDYIIVRERSYISTDFIRENFSAPVFELEDQIVLKFN